MLLSSLRSSYPPWGLRSRLSLKIIFSGWPESEVGIGAGSVEVVLPHLDYLFFGGGAVPD